MPHRPRRQAWRIRRIHPPEGHPLPRDAVDVRAGGPRIAVATKVVRADTVHVDVKDSHGFSQFLIESPSRPAWVQDDAPPSGT